VKSKNLLYSIFLAAALFAAFIYPLAAAEDKPEDKLAYTLISSEGLSYTNDMLRQSIKKLFPNAQERYLEYNSKEAQKYIKELNIKSVPYVIYDNSITAADKFFHMVRNVMIDKVKGYYIIPQAQLKMGEYMILGRNIEPNKLCIFVMGLCPYAREAEANLIDFIRQNKTAVSIKIRYLVDIHEFGIYSPRGPDEIKEDLRQIIIQKYYPDKFMDYLLARQTKKAEDAAKELSLSLEEIDSKAEEAKSLLKEDFESAKELGITRSPAFLWENVYLIQNLDGLKQHKPFDVKKKQTEGLKKQ
jgi:glutaredoxin